ncbi:urea ABC transporter permease subunit UrtB [Sedimentitalea sp. JM2-8]|uniref:Urea ABC transporter permease subunit UrtB n=1 Tax=Sedimentitalea xiamensis TaxID=3050037 RepID=A0ABT7FI30_9RHOB|nr:urea ABC transporter permease subunit UrtB [Sedimentitalea xiamensis]MDK3074792.1 urea ABC transporter permease subunit UrtB [Sedimentitalea xiamensis]
MRYLRAALAGLILLAVPLVAQQAPESGTPVQDLLQTHADQIAKSSRRTIQPVIDALVASGLPQIETVLATWQAREIWQRESDGLFFAATETDNSLFELTDFDTGEPIGAFPRDGLAQVKPNSGVQGLIATALVQFQLNSPDPAQRRQALDSLARAPDATLLAPLRASIEPETDPDIRARKQRLATLLTIAHDSNEAARIAAIAEVSGDLSVDVRATLNPLLSTHRTFAAADAPLAGDQNVARTLVPGRDIPVTEAYALLVAAGDAPALVSEGAIREALAVNIAEGRVGGVPIAALSDPEARNRAYDALAAAGAVPPRVDTAERDASLAAHRFYDVYDEPSAALTDAAQQALGSIETRVGINQALDLGLDALSLASIYFLAAIGLAITFGVMGVINMAHGEFIMMGAYTGYVVQQVIPDYTVSILVALPLAFAVTFAAGVAMERLVIRHLYHRPLETLLATFGISIALQQIAKNIFGTQARPLTSPGWLDGAWVLNDVVSISYIRIAIFVLALIFLTLFLFIMRHTRLGLETRAVTQNPRMAASMGINPDRVNMLSFGLGSGIAGVAGVAIGLYAKVTSELGQDYIVQSFMTVVVGGVGNIWGTLLGATMIGSLQKGIEWLNPSNTLAAQTYMIVFIIIFIQFRPRGIIALRGRAAGD